MPNGGSDNCGTCQFNRKNRDWTRENRQEAPGPAHCVIRDLEIQIPYWTYCANHFYRGQDWRVGDSIPIGPVLTANISGGNPYERVPWHSSPDGEDIRQRLLDQVSDPASIDAGDSYPYAMSTGNIVIWQLGEFREQRAIAPLEAIVERGPEHLVSEAAKALRKIRTSQ